MKTSHRTLGAALAVLTMTALTSCGSGSGSGAEPAADGTVTLKYLVDNGQGAVDTAKAMTEAFMKANPKIKIEMETRPAGSEGDNIVKTRQIGRAHV